MPKVRVRNSVSGAKSWPVSNKFRLGMRKTGISAHSLSTEDLISQYFEPKLPKDKFKIGQVLRLRNVMIPDSLPTEDEATVE